MKKSFVVLIILSLLLGTWECNTSPTDVFSSPTPALKANAAIALGPTVAVLSGYVNPNGFSTSYHFEYGATESYGRTTGTKDVGFGTAPVHVTDTLGNLTMGTLYHWKMVAVYGVMSASTRDSTFSTLVDVFPLAIGSTYRYSYQLSSQSSYLLPPDLFASGYIEYNVLDSIRATDAVRMWTVQESRHLVKKNFFIFWPDTIRWVWDSTVISQDSTVILNLQESLTGSHELQCPGLVWSFPLDSDNIYSAAGSTSANFRMHRYAGEAEIRSAYQFSHSADGRLVWDTVALESLRGMTYRDTWWGGYALTAPRGNRLVVLLDPAGKWGATNQHEASLFPETKLKQTFKSGRRRN